MGSVEESLADVARRTREYGATLTTEEATKNAIVMPFISQVLGYDVFNPAEVVPEFVADVGLKKGEKIDYAIMRDSRVNILIEAKKVGESLNVEHASQLVRYFHVSEARIGVLTNGRTWHFYTDLDKPNVMDGRPFLVLDLLDIDASAIPHLRKMAKDTFDLESVLASAEELKYVSAVKRELGAELDSPGEDFVRLLAKRVYPGPITSRVLDLFTEITEKASRQLVSDRVNSRLKTALGDHDVPVPVIDDTAVVGSASAREEVVEAGETPVHSGVVTTEDELEGFMILRAISASVVPISRVVMRDQKSYCAILLDDNNRKPIARLFFEGRAKRIGLFDENKVMTRFDLDSVEMIYDHADAIRETIGRYVTA